ncbi:MAG: Flp1 family type IVb pilin [Brotaphodocola sp.]
MEMLKKFYEEEDGMGTVEIVMIMAALICLAIIFKDSLLNYGRSLMKTAFGQNVGDFTSNAIVNENGTVTN